jgi:hypothetical protein
MFPSLTESLMGAKYDRTTPPGKISRELREAGIPYLVSKDDPRGFHWHGMYPPIPDRFRHGGLEPAAEPSRL